MKFTNIDNLPLSLAVWLATDDYDYNNDPNVISTTSLLKPLRAIVLARQNAGMLKVGDVSAMISSRMGTALHTGIENAWLEEKRLKETLTNLGYPKAVINQVVINPTSHDLGLAEAASKPIIPVYMEQRGEKAVGDMKVSGKFDFVSDGILEDFKSTSVYSYQSGSNNQKYIEQGSIYRWLFPEIITADEMYIQFIFTDWSKGRTYADKSYPKNRIVPHKLQLMPVHETEKFVTKRVNDITKLMGASQDQLPLCTKEELWQKDDIYKYYKDPKKKARSTKNFTTKSEAVARLVKDGSIGVVDFFPGEVIHCKYCDVVGICDQAKSLVTSGMLKL
jgi:hypothetical protein